jgi:hypothetical protein
MSFFFLDYFIPIGYLIMKMNNSILIKIFRWYSLKKKNPDIRDVCLFNEDANSGKCIVDHHA